MKRMKINQLTKLSLVIPIVFTFISLKVTAQTVDDYLKVLKNEGENPVTFIQNRLKEYDLIIFDDALHPALEPFEFYTDLLTHKDSRIEYVFVELFSSYFQDHIDAYLSNPVKDSTLLFEVFQTDYSGYGIRFRTYYDLLSSIWDLNQNKEASERIKVITVNQPIYWNAIHNRSDYLKFLETLVARDYYMYKMIINTMRNFNVGKKGVFLTNTRHAYKNIKDKKGEPFWNTGTFFYNWHPGKTYSARIHNVTLSVEKKVEAEVRETAEGMEQYSFRWIRMDNGLWDEAFELNNMEPVGIPLKNNVFGNTGYIGNQSLHASVGQTMYDAYDALIFLKPIDNLHFSGTIDFIYTDEFKEELRRRIEIIEENNIDSFLNQNGVKSIDEFINTNLKNEPATKNKLLKGE